MGLAGYDKSRFGVRLNQQVREIMALDLKNEVKEVVEPILNQERFDLVEVKLSRFKNQYSVQLFVDSDNGAPLDECARLSRIIGAAFEASDLFGTGYVLEVSSPGLDRPLVSYRDFSRRIGKKMRVDFVQNKKDTSAEGLLAEVAEEFVVLNVKGDKREIPLSDIRFGKIII